MDRLADMEIMPDTSTNMGAAYQSYLSGADLNQTNMASSQSGIKHVAYNDVWEQYNMSFTVWHPISDSHEEWIFDNNRASDI